MSQLESNVEEDLLQYCKRLPKVELHAHLNGSISDKTMYELAQRKKGCANLPETWETTIAKGQKRTMEEYAKNCLKHTWFFVFFLSRCFQMFKIIHEIVDSAEALSKVAHDVVKEFAADGVVYLELRSTPRANPKTGMTKSSYVDAVIHGVLSALETTPIHVRLLLSIDRRQSPAEALETVLLAEKYSKKLDCPVRVVGVDLSGDPRASDMAALLPVLKMIKEKNLNFAMHLSEIPARNKETLLLLKGAPPDRIGHGTFLHPDVGGTEEIVQEVTNRAVPIELCLSSNLKTQTVSSIESHHFRFWQDRNHPIVICTDDKGIFATSLSEEYHMASQAYNLSKKQLWQLSVRALEYTFEHQSSKEELRKLWDL